jgi:ASCH domain
MAVYASSVLLVAPLLWIAALTRKDAVGLFCAVCVAAIGCALLVMGAGGLRWLGLAPAPAVYALARLMAPSAGKHHRTSIEEDEDGMSAVARAGPDLFGSKPPVIKGLSIRQPWTWAIACAGKTVENRTWGTEYRGLLAIHASKTRPRQEDLDSDLIIDAVEACGFVIDEAASGSGAIVAVAELSGCHLSPDFGGTCGATRPLCSPWAVRDQYHWVLTDVRRLPVPVPCKGALKLWTLPGDVERAVLDQIGVPGHG